MKQLKRLKRSQKELLSKKGYDSEKYGLLSEGATSYIFVHRDTMDKLVIDK